MLRYDTQFPHDPDQEKGVLASVLLSPPEVLDMCDEYGVTVESFYLGAHQDLFRALLHLRKTGQPIEFLTLAGYLRDRNQLDAIGGSAFLNELQVLLPSAAYVYHHIHAVRAKQILRAVLYCFLEEGKKAGQQIDPADVLTLVRRVESQMATLGAEHGKKPRKMKDMVMKAIGDIQKLYDNRGKVNGLETGFHGFDQLTDGLQPAEMYVIAARPSMGKTALAMNMVEHIACQLKLPVAVFSLEMNAGQLVQRMLCSMARVNARNIARGFLSERDFPALMAVAENLARANITIDDKSGMPISELRAKARRLRESEKVVAIFIDYLQLITSPDHKDNRQQEVAFISGELKAMAKELNIPVVVLAQINRSPDARTGNSKGRPRISDLRESGSIEQDADLVALLMREELYCDNEEDKEQAKGKATLQVAKQRNGPVGDIALTFLKEFTRFVDRAGEDYEPEVEQSEMPI